MKKLITLILISISTGSFSQALITDTYFGDNGETFSLPTGTTSETNVMFQYPDKKTVACGQTYDISCNCFYNLMFRVDACGQIDSSFGLDGLVRHTFDQRNAGYGYTLLPSGKIIAVGMQSDGNAGSQQFPFIARYKYDGQPDSTFAINGTYKINYLGPAEFTSVFQLDTGKLLCTNGRLMMRFDSLGAEDPTFGNNGVLMHPVPSPLSFYYQASSVMRSDGKIVSFSNAYTGVDNDKYVAQMCYNIDGLIDSTFGTNGFTIDYNFVVGTAPPRLVLQSDDKIVAIRQNINETAIILARYNTNGSLDTTFGSDGYLNIQSSRLVYVSSFSDDSFLIGVSQSGVPIQYIRITANGIIDPSFTLNGSVYFQTMGNNGPSPQTGLSFGNNEIVMAGCTSGANGSTAIAFAKFTTSTGIANITQTGNLLDANVESSNYTFQWYLDGNELEGANSSTFLVNANGLYTVVISNLAGCESVDDFQVTGVGINEIENNTITVYPNPATNHLTIQFSNTLSPSTISMYDVIGKRVFEKVISNTSSTQIDVSAFAKGTYNLQIVSKEGKSNHKIIVQ